MMAAKWTRSASVSLISVLFLAAANPEPQKPAATTPAEASAQTADPAVSVIGLGVRSAGYRQAQTLFKSAGNVPGSIDTQPPAFDLVLHVATEKHDLVSLDRAVIESLTDEAGRDHSLGMTSTTSRLFFPADTNVALDHKHAFIGISFPNPPSGRTVRMTIRGMLYAQSGGKPQMLTFEDVPFAKGSKFRVLGHDYTLQDIWSDETRPDQVYFRFAGDGSYALIRGIRFLSPDGKRVVGTVMRVDRNLRQPTELLCRVSGQQPDSMRIEVDTYETAPELAIPFQLNLDLGVLASGEPVKLVTTGTLPAAPVAEGIKSDSQVLALTMTGPVTSQQEKAWFGDRSSVAAFRNPGISMQVKVHVSDHQMVRLANGNGTALSLTDDTGARLLNAVVTGNNNRMAPREMSPISADGHDAWVVVTADSLPSTGARELHFKGKVGVVLAETEKMAEAKGVVLLPGTTFKVGEVEMTVTSVRAAGAAGNGMYLTLTAAKKVQGTVTLLNETGRPLASSPFAAERYPGQMQGEGNAVGFTLAKALETVTVQLRTTSDQDAVSVPVEFTVPLGLGSEK